MHLRPSLVSVCFTLILSTRLLASAPVAPPPSTPTDAAANVALQQGRVEEAANMLHSILAARPQDAQAHQLLCRVFYSQDLAEPSIHECELAVAAASSSSDNHLWLGRAYGMKASHLNPFTAIGLAKRVRDEFEVAAQLDPLAPRASSDLCQFYISAPGFAGGDPVRAQSIIDRMEPQFPVFSHRLRAMRAEDNNDYVTAEAEFKNAIASAKGPAATSGAAAAWIDLASFYRRRKQQDRVVPSIQSALALSPQDAVLVDAASILTSAHRAPDLAEQLLWQYLKSPAQTDEAPVFKVHVQLGKLLAHRGDITGARAEYNKAITLAPAYEPARRALQSL